ncbi:hypothetical protein WMY93_008314 [Mugilogobius chulae]|uniref:Histamine N-methyltransferase n=1 Tax=Mugilogobius chulae TaxID=88201 RepID=A0AAW0PM05_9GOBI
MFPDIVDSIGNGKPQINVIGVGSGEGINDMKMLSQLRRKYPGLLLENEVVEPSKRQINKFREKAANTSDLDPIKFIWNQMTAAEFEKQWRQRKINKKVDIVHMFHMLYYVEDPGATINFFQSLLNKNGKLLISLVTNESGWMILWRTFHRELRPQKTDVSFLNTAHIKKLLDERGVSYQTYNLLPEFDITACFTVGDEAGELLLDFLTETVNFSKTAPPELKHRVLKLLRDNQCSVERDGKVLLSIEQEIIILEGLS